MRIHDFAKKDLEDAAAELINVTKTSMSLIPHPNLAKAQASIQAAVTQLKSEGAESSEYNLILAQLVRTACADIV